ncbi:MAG: undecaprenyl/decaprenyl-phosphate alpha-N-acetylglucosaminyl 1-phosphate transferase [Pirellulales bacterium]|nr:undecaprenyl/decaprenyl-phosphate alpha-N-acetylglucosaminyl 1-phosphate transferase [Pirellulales bacterium]
MKWLVLFAAVPSCLITSVAVWLVRPLARRWGLVDHPSARKNHRGPIPLGGGLAIWLGILIPFVAMFLMLSAVFRTDPATGPLELEEIGLHPYIAQYIPGLAAQQGKLWILLAAATAMLVVGLWDDWRPLKWGFRLGFQTLIACLVVWQGWRMSLFIDAPAITFCLSVIWIVGIVNAFNMLDNMDGLSAGVACIASTLLAIVMLIAPDPQTHAPQLFVAGFLMVLAGALAGFLWHNRLPASIFMGDAGSYLIGFLIATSTLMATFAGGNLPRHAILAPLCVLAVPIYDTLTVLGIRFREGRSPVVGDRSHFSHRLVELGLSPKQAVWTIYLLTAACGLGALLLHQVRGFGAWIVLLMIVCILIVIAILETIGRRH